MSAFAFKKIIWSVVSIGNALCLALFLLLIAVSLYGFTKCIKAGFLIVFACLFIITITPISSILMSSLEDRYAPIAIDSNELSDVTGFIVLGGMVQEALSNDLKQIQFNNSSDRGLAFLKLLTKYPEKRFVFTGGSPRILYQQEDKNEAELFEKELNTYSVNKKNVLFEKKSRDTFENALYTYDLVKPKETEKWVIITSAFHMHRAMLLFESAGWKNITAYPVDYRAEKQYSISFSDNLKLFEIAQKEYFALLWYTLTGKVS